jgi:hypothetical protein
MLHAPLTPPSCDDLDAATAAFYRQVLQILDDAGVPFLVGGAYAFACCTGIERQTKDLDLFLRRSDYERAAQALQAAGHRPELTYPHWLAKVRAGGEFIDLIFNSGNGIALVDDDWFRHALDAPLLDRPVKVAPVEETIWSKAFIMERERYDGADVAHLLHARATDLDWQRLLLRFGAHWRVLLSHLVLFGFIYPDERRRVPAWVMRHLLDRLRAETEAPPPQDRVSEGTLLSRQQYLSDLEAQGYRDGRARPRGNMSEDEIAQWTRAIPEPPGSS